MIILQMIHHIMKNIVKKDKAFNFTTKEKIELYL